MKNIMFLTRSLCFGGAERQLVLLARGLAERGHSVSIVLFYNEGELLQDLEGTNVKVHVLRKKGRWDLIGFMRSLYGLVKTVNPDVIHGYLVVPNIISVMLKMMGCRQTMVWGVRASDMDFKNYDWTAGVTFKLSCILSRFADLIIANSYAGKEFHQLNGYPASKTIVISNGIDTETFKPDEQSRKRLRNEWGIADDVSLIGIVARIDPMKNYELFIDAARELIKCQKGVRFVCVGDGAEAYRDRLREQARDIEQSGHLIWAGKRSDMPAVYNALDIFTSCSATGEGFPNVIGEAMSCGTPCVVTNVGDSSYVVGEYGVVLSDRTVDSLTRAWDSCLADKKLRSSHATRQRILDNFTPEVLVSNTEAQLKKVFEST